MTRGRFDPTELEALPDDLIALARELDAAGSERVPDPSDDFIDRVMRAVMAEPIPTRRGGSHWIAGGWLLAVGRGVVSAWVVALGRPGTVRPTARIRAVAIVLVAALMLTVAGTGLAVGGPALARLFGGPETPAATRSLILPTGTPESGRPSRPPTAAPARSTQPAFFSEEPTQTREPSDGEGGRPEGTSEPTETSNEPNRSEPIQTQEPGDTGTSAPADDPDASAGD